jgi:hypothetical protein
MCWIDESFHPSESKYYWGGERFSNHLFEYSQLLDLADGVVVKSGCLVPLPAGDGGFETIEGVHPNEYEYDGNAPPGGITVVEFPRSGQVLSDFTSHFDRIREGYWPDYVCLSVDNSTSMTTSTIEPYYSEQTGNNFKYWLGTNYPDAAIKARDQEPPSAEFTSELWVDEMRIQVEDVLDEL